MLSNTIVVAKNLSCLFIIMFVFGCARIPVVPEVDLNDGAWKMWTGQASWKRGHDAPAISGELLLAQHQNGDVFINFAKPPLVIFNAQTHANVWQLDLIHANQSHRGWGPGPTRFIWFYLPQMLADQKPLPSYWRVKNEAAPKWLIENAKSGETIRLFLDE